MRESWWLTRVFPHMQVNKTSVAERLFTYYYLLLFTGLTLTDIDSYAYVPCSGSRLINRSIHQNLTTFLQISSLSQVIQLLPLYQAS